MGSSRVQGKVTVVTGAGSGIGRATAILFAKEGADVLASDLDLTAARSVATEIVVAGGNAEPVRLDVTDEPDWRHVVEKILVDYQRLDVLVNNAGVSFAKPADAMSIDEWRKVMAVNLDGVFLGTKHAIAAMTKGNGGSIINVASVSGITPSAGASAYCASKAAVRMFSKTVAIECANSKTGIRVNVVAPGGVKTPMWKQMPFFQDMTARLGGSEEAFATMAGDVPSQQFFLPEEIAQTILYLASDESSHLTGIEIVMDRRKG